MPEESIENRAVGMSFMLKSMKINLQAKKWLTISPVDNQAQTLPIIQEMKTQKISSCSH
jgi:hypothetical protein